MSNIYQLQTVLKKCTRNITKHTKIYTPLFISKNLQNHKNSYVLKTLNIVGLVEQLL